LFPDRYECQTVSCAPFNDWDWYATNFSNSTKVCVVAHQGMINGFMRIAPTMCRQMKAVGMEWQNCRRDFCEMYDSAMQKILHLGGPGYYGFDECRPFLDFNKTLCETEYRDAEVFCECYCPMMPLLEPIRGCENEIMEFLLLGRRSPLLAEKYPLSENCAADLCRWYELIGDPQPVNPVDIAYGVPSACHTIGLPFRPKQCVRMLTTIDGSGAPKPYEPCPWREPGSEDDVVTCSDGSTHTISHSEVDSWSVCVDHNFRWTCPANYPIMCEGRNCDGSDDHCCQTSVDRCKSGAERQCSPALRPSLEEWRGLLHPAAVIRRGTTTTENALNAFLMITQSTTSAPNFAGQVDALLPAVVAGCAAFGAATLAAICFWLGKEHYKSVVGTVTGLPKLMQAYHLDPVHHFGPTVGAQDPNMDRDKPLPPMRSKAELAKELADNAASTALAAAVSAAYNRGFSGFCAYDGCPPPAEEEPLAQALAVVRERGLENEGGNAVLVERSDSWLRVLRSERMLMKVAAETRPALAIVGKRGTMMRSGEPWLTTLQGQRFEGDLQETSWAKVERLTVAIKEAKAAGAQDGLVKKEARFLAELVARVPELPADRCVLDPEGEGLKLLPKGHQRAIQTKFGDPYTYQTENREASDFDVVPPRQELGDVAVDASRPCCAEWVKSRTCKGGRRCPWRHEMPRAGDVVRECILRRDDDR